MSEYIITEPEELHLFNRKSFEEVQGQVYKINDKLYTVYFRKFRDKLIKKMGLENEDNVDLGIKHGDHYEWFIEKILVSQFHPRWDSVSFLCPEEIINHIGLKHKDDVDVIMRKVNGK